MANKRARSDRFLPRCVYISFLLAFDFHFTAFSIQTYKNICVYSARERKRWCIELCVYTNAQFSSLASSSSSRLLQVLRSEWMSDFLKEIKLSAFITFFIVFICYLLQLLLSRLYNNWDWLLNICDKSEALLTEQSEWTQVRERGKDEAKSEEERKLLHVQIFLNFITLIIIYISILYCKVFINHLHHEGAKRKRVASARAFS